MKGYNHKIAKSLDKLRKLTEQLHEILSAINSPMQKSLKIVLCDFFSFDIIGFFPEDTYDVILARAQFINLEQKSHNSKRCIVIDNRDGKISYKRKSGFICNTDDVARNHFALAVMTVLIVYEEAGLLEKLPENTKSIINEMQEILKEWAIFSNKFSNYILKQAEANIENNSALIEAVFEPMFQPEIARRKGKMEQRQARGKLYDDFLEIRHNHSTTKAAYIELAKRNLNAEIKAFDERKNIISYIEGLKLEKSLNDKIKREALSIKRAIIRAKADRAQQEKE